MGWAFFQGRLVRNTRQVSNHEGKRGCGDSAHDFQPALPHIFHYLALHTVEVAEYSSTCNTPDWRDTNLTYQL